MFFKSNLIYELDKAKEIFLKNVKKIEFIVLFKFKLYNNNYFNV
jgi:hypothetical protein